MEFDGSEPSERARVILRALVEHYIREGQPVGSKTLAGASGLKLSPASIRNIMADLEELGFIASPHTSAGRIPTPKGYRFFVDTLVKLQAPPRSDLLALQQSIEGELTGDSRQIVAKASSMLSSLTSLAGIVTIPRQPKVVLRQIEYLPLSDRRVLAILVVNDSEVQNRILSMDRDYTADELQRVANYLNEHYAGRDLRDIRSEILTQLGDTRESVNQMMIDVVAMADKALDLETGESGYVMSGETKLMDFAELSDLDKLKQLFRAFNQQREILGLLDRSISADGVQIFIGQESGYQILDDCSIVAAPYSVDQRICGVLGVIGPTRMAYERVIPIVDVTAKLISSALNSSH